MRLRIALFTAALLLSVAAGFVAAEEPADENTRRETATAAATSAVTSAATSVRDDPTFGRYSYAPSGNETVSIVRPKYNGIAEAERSWTVSSGRELSEAETEPLSAYHADNLRSVYDLAVSFDDGDLDEIGIVGRSDIDDAPDASGENAESSAGFLVSDNGPYSILVFEKKAFKNGKNRPQIISESSYSINPNDTEEYTRSPYSAPFSMLIVLIVICIIVILFTSTGLKLKD